MSIALAATEYGQGAPLLVLHGLFGSGRNWTSIAQKLADSRHVITLDLRNHGASPWQSAMSYPEMAADLLAFIETRRLGPSAVLGHSMGGKVAMAAALARPDLVERLIAVDIAPVLNPPNLLSYVQAMRGLDLGAVTRRNEVDAALAAAVPNPAERGFLLQNLVLEEGGARWRLNLEAIERDFPAIIGFPELPPAARYDGPALFVAGAKSDYVRTQDEPEIRRLFPQAEIVRIPGVGHWVHAEAPDAFLAAVRPFLAAKE